MDTETEKFATDVLKSIRQMKLSEFGQLQTAEEINACPGSRFGTKISIPSKTESAVIKSDVQPLNTA